MKHKTKVFFFLIFTLVILYMGVWQVNQSNYKVIENGKKEVISYRIEDGGTEFTVFGEQLYIDHDRLESIKETISSVRP